MSEPVRAPMSTRRLLARLLPYARPDLRLYGAAVVATPIAAALSLVQPAIVQRALDHHVVTGQLEGLGTLLLLYLGSVAAWLTMDVGSTLALAFAGQRSVLRLREALFAHVLDLPQRFHDLHATGGLLTRITSDVEALAETLTSRVVTIGMDVLVMVGALVAMLLLDARLTLLLVLLAPPLLAVVELCRRQLRKLYLEVRTALSSSNAYMTERIDGLEVIQLFGAQDASLRRFAERNERYRKATVTANVWDALMYATVDGASAICIAALLWYAASAMGAEVSIGLLVAFLQFLERLFQPLREVSSKISVIQRASAAMERIALLLDTPARRRGTTRHSSPSGRISIRNLSFSYGPELPDVLRGIDLEIAPGEVVALVGPTGCGKTTLTRLITGAYDGYRGSIRLDGEELSALDPQSLHDTVVPVLQESQLFPGSVALNIHLGQEVSQDELERAAGLAQAHDLVAALEGGYEHRLGHHGQGISVGQGQLLGFARALLRESPVVVLDEATASIDSITEGLVQEAVARILEQRTVLVVAHRLSTITRADKIAVLDAGRIVELGNHAELLAAGGAYANLYAKGFGEAEASTGSTLQG
jgi:ATP-binding cassette subfamily B multidrug efflux pump